MTSLKRENFCLYIHNHFLLYRFVAAPILMYKTKGSVAAQTINHQVQCRLVCTGIWSKLEELGIAECENTWI